MPIHATKIVLGGFNLMFSKKHIFNILHEMMY